MSLDSLNDRVWSEIGKLYQPVIDQDKKISDL